MRSFSRAAAATVSAVTVLSMAACAWSGSTTPGSASSSASSAVGSVSMSAGSATSSSSMTGAHNASDVAFSTDMIPHHGQAVQMADLALSQATTAAVKKLAAQIKAAQGPEIATMSGWLKAWGSPVPSASMATGSMGGMAMNGMMSAQQMTQLGQASGAAFDKLWVQMMIAHHQGALAMAKTELAAGTDAASKAQAQSITDSQSKEMASMQALLATL